MANRFFLSALGIISSLGNSTNEVFNNLILGKSKNIIKRNDLVFGKELYFATVDDDLPQIPQQFAKYNTRCNQMLLAAYLQIENNVEEVVKKYGKDRVAVVIGSSTSGISEGQKGLEVYFKQQEPKDNFDCSFLEMGHPAKFLSDYLGLNNIFYTISTACSSSAKAFLSAQNLINLGLCDAVLVGGSDSLCQLVANGFYSMESVSKGVCNPFSKNRDGITLGEGAALFLMTKDQGNICLFGVGESSDSYHATAPDPSGKGAIAAIASALKMANLKPQDIDYINLHGTGTILNDQMESLAVNFLFSDKTLCSSTKPLTGHTLGSAGIIEAGLCWLLLSNINKNNQLPAHIWDGEVDFNLPKINFVSSSYEMENRKINFCLSNSFAFGGSNVSVIIGAV